MTFSERVAYWVVPSRTGGFAWSPYAGWTQNLGVAAGVAGALMLAAWLGGAIGHTLGWPPDATLPFEGAVAQRHLSLSRRTLFPRRGHKRPPTVVMTMMSVAGITVGTWAMIVVLSVMSGFELDLKKKILGINAHGIVLKHTTSFTEWKELLPKVAEVPGVAGATPFIHAEGMVVTRSNPTGAIIRGIDPATVGRVSDLPASVESGDLMHLADPAKIAVPARLEPADTTPTPGAEKPPLLPGVALGREMARTLKVWVGDPVTIVNPIGELGPTGPVPRSRQFRVAAIFYSGMYEYDAKIAFIGLREAQTFFGLGEAVSGIEVKTGEMDEAPAIMKRVRNALQGFPYGVKDWGEMNRNLFSALRLEKIVMGIILAFIVLVATFTIVATLLMMVVQKSREVAILKSMGARDASVMKIFVLEGLILGALGAALGTALGLSSCVVIQVLGINLDPEVYYISSLPVQIVPVQIAVVAVTAFILSFMATVYPAISASRLPPVEAFKE
jgi:lipoprotein-releasing system permease protein